MKRWMLAICLALTGFAVSLFIAGWRGAGEGQGLAGGAIVFGYGLLGAIIAISAFLFPEHWLTPLLKILIVPACIIAFTILTGYLQSRQQLNEHLQQAYDNLPPFHLALESGPPFRGEPIETFEADWRTRELRFSTQQRHCSGALHGQHAVELLTALRGAESVTYRNATPCARDASDNSWTLSFTIEESTAGITQAKTRVTPACLQRYPALAAPREAAGRILSSGEVALECSALKH